MAEYSVAEARNRLPALLAAAERGERVTITRRGTPVVELTPLGTPKPVTREAVEALRRQLAHVPPLPEDGSTVVRRMRDEDAPG